MDKIMKTTQNNSSHHLQCKNLHTFQNLKNTQDFAIKTAQKNTQAILNTFKK